VGADGWCVGFLKTGFGGGFPPGADASKRLGARRLRRHLGEKMCAADRGWCARRIGDRNCRVRGGSGMVCAADRELGTECALPPVNSANSIRLQLHSCTGAAATAEKLTCQGLLGSCTAAWRHEFTCGRALFSWESP